MNLNRAEILLPNGSIKQVKNLGWLLRNWKRVTAFRVSKYSGPTPVTDALLEAFCEDGTLYRTPFASSTILRDWLHRPVFRTLPLDWFGAQTTC